MSLPPDYHHFSPPVVIFTECLNLLLFECQQTKKQRMRETNYTNMQDFQSWSCMNSSLLGNSIINTIYDKMIHNLPNILSIYQALIIYFNTVVLQCFTIVWTYYNVFLLIHFVPALFNNRNQDNHQISLTVEDVKDRTVTNIIWHYEWKDLWVPIVKILRLIKPF